MIQQDNLNGAVRPLRLAVSGTYGTGKTTTTEALAIATGVPRTHAMTAREILRDLMPGKTLEELSAAQLIQLGLRRLEERIHSEAALPGSFVSDGSVVHEWIYGEARMRIGINPAGGPLLRTAKRVAGLPYQRFYQQYMDAYGVIVKNRAKWLYDAYIHLPVEFELKSDGHRPVSEPFRLLSDRLLVETIEEIQVPYHVVHGSVHERLEQIIDIHRLRPVMPLADAVAEARRRVAAASAELEAYARTMAAARDRSLWRRMRYAMRY
jgi:hypothetical protein